MLKPAQLYTHELKIKFWEIAYDEKYMFAYSGHNVEYEPTTDNWNQHEFASVDKNNNVLGYIAYEINQKSKNVNGLFIINFSNNKLTFGKDVFQAIDDIFIKYKYNKLNYGVNVGNPIETTYDKLTKKYGGRIVGIKKKDVMLLDGSYCDYKMYEIFREDYLKNRKDG